MHPPVASPTSPPPFDGSLLLPEIFIHHATHSPEHPLFRYLDTSGDVHTVSWSQGVRVFHAASHILDNHIPPTGLEHPIVAILASIGSVSFPKIIPITNRFLFESGTISLSLSHGTGHAEIDVCGEVLSSHAVPMFHLMGVIQLPWAAFTGMTITVFPPTVPPVVPTAARVFDGAVATGSTLMYSVPSFLEIFAGGPLQCSAYVDPVFVPLPDIPGVYHLVVKAYHMLSQKCPTHTPAILNTIVDGVPALNTNDLFVRHPVNPKLWKVFSRNDDQIMHSTGEKTNPGPLGNSQSLRRLFSKIRELNMRLCSGVESSMGVLIFLTDPFDPADTARGVAFRQKIWPTVEQANRFAPTHSRIFKEMILVANPLKPFELTAKGYPCRQVVLDMYQDEIRAFMPR
ncbi:hypothetical protein B0H10DRAFT_1958887 [Mycena sp. CBHHK59/15]|nr:hypothetical protein B0H10DRAFT_1958887 [Mycena sp. CBHHK59/15]